MTEKPDLEREDKPQTAGEEIANAVIHILGSHLGAAMIALLVWQAVHSDTDLGWKITSGCIFGAMVILLYSISGAYHAVMHPPAKRVLQVMDHMAIYFLIAGSYTPFCLQTLRVGGHAALGWSIFGIEWAACFAGVIFKIRTTGRFRYVSTGAYVVMGWVAIVALPYLVSGLGGFGTMWLALGGGLYTGGCLFYLWRSLPYHHAIWHLFVLAGSICHFFCILWHVMA
jgi:hemolysin III